MTGAARACFVFVVDSSLMVLDWMSLDLKKQAREILSTVCYPLEDRYK